MADGIETEGGGVNIESLIKAQEKHEEELKAQERAKQERLDKQAALAGATDRRQEAYAEIKQTEAELEELRNKNIDSGIAAAEETLTKIGGQESLLAGLLEDAKAKGDTIDRIKKIISGKSDEEIAPAVKEALERVKRELTAVESDIRESESALTKLKVSVVSDEDALNYKNLVRRSIELGHELTDIEKTPGVLEALMEEAVPEDKSRKAIVKTLISKSPSFGRRMTGLEEKLTERLTNAYLSTEFEGLTDEERAKNLSDLRWMININEPNQYSARRILENYGKKNPTQEDIILFDASSVLMWLACGTDIRYFISTVRESEMVQQGGVREENIKKYCLKHIDTLNMAVAISRATRPSHSIDFRGLASEISKNNIGAFDPSKGPIIPSGISEHEKEEIIAKYDQQLSWVTQEVLADLESTIKKYSDELKHVEDALAEKEDKIKKAKEVIAEYHKRTEEPSIETEINNLDSKITLAEADLKAANDAADSAGFFTRRKKDLAADKAEKTLLNLREELRKAQEKKEQRTRESNKRYLEYKDAMAFLSQDETVLYNLQKRQESLSHELARLQELKKEKTALLEEK